MTDNKFQGVKLEDNYTKFGVYSPEAQMVELCLFSDNQEHRIPMSKDDSGNWYLEIENNLEGMQYGYRVM